MVGDFLAKIWAHRKLSKGQCAACGAILPDVRPVKNWRACSEECADHLWVSATA